ncbi:MAG: hypothetical protein WC511_02820 [Candidatus Pacearchaeota archaeon]
MHFKVNGNIEEFRFHKGHAFKGTSAISLCETWFVNHKAERDPDSLESIRCVDCRVKMPSKEKIVVEAPKKKTVFTPDVLGTTKAQQELLKNAQFLKIHLTEADKPALMKLVQETIGFASVVANEKSQRKENQCPFCMKGIARITKFQSQHRDKKKRVEQYQMLCHVCHARGPVCESEKEAKDKWNF